LHDIVILIWNIIRKWGLFMQSSSKYQKLASEYMLVIGDGLAWSV